MAVVPALVLVFGARWVPDLTVQETGSAGLDVRLGFHGSCPLLL